MGFAGTEFAAMDMPTTPSFKKKMESLFLLPDSFMADPVNENCFSTWCVVLLMRYKTDFPESEAKAQSAIPYDIPDVEFTHEGERCSFDTFLRTYDIADPPLEHLALIVRGADTSHHELTPQCDWLFAISLGLSANFADDHEMLDHGMVIYDALYTWCRSLQAETHGAGRHVRPTKLSRRL